MEFCKAFNAQTQGAGAGSAAAGGDHRLRGQSFTFIIKTPPATTLIKKAIKLDKGSPKAAQRQGGKITRVPARRDRQDQDEGHEQLPPTSKADQVPWLVRPLDGRDCGGCVTWPS